MLTILLTCLLSAWDTFTPPPQWEVVKIVAVPSSSMTYCLAVSCNPSSDKQRAHTEIHLRRTIKPGDEVKPPDGCTLSFTAPKE